MRHSSVWSANELGIAIWCHGVVRSVSSFAVRSIHGTRPRSLACVGVARKLAQGPAGRPSPSCLALDSLVPLSVLVVDCRVCLGLCCLPMVGWTSRSPFGRCRDKYLCKSERGTVSNCACPDSRVCKAPTRNVGRKCQSGRASPVVAVAHIGRPFSSACPDSNRYS